MPFVLGFAQITGIAQRQEFIASVLVITSIAPIQIYLNEVFAPRVVRYKRGIDVKHALEICFCTLALTLWSVYRLELEYIPSILVIVFAQGYIWFSYVSSRKVLKFQSEALIGGRYSYIIGAVIPLTFLLIVVVYWGLSQLDLDWGGLLYFPILLPNAIQYIYIRLLGMPQCEIDKENDLKHSGQRLWPGYFPIAVLMAIVSQHWKVELVSSAVGFSALSIYMIVPFSSAWLILSKSKYLTQEYVVRASVFFWGGPVFVGGTLLLSADSFLWVFALALVTQVLTFKFITDVRLKASAAY